MAAIPQQSFPNQFSNTASVTSTGLGLAFQFQATWLELVNDGPVGVFLAVRSTSPASTSDYLIRSGEFYSATLVTPTWGIGLMTTTTSTGVADSPQVRVFAAGG